MDQSRLYETLAYCYRRQGVAADRLPYTKEFEQLYQDVQQQSGETLTRAEFWRVLANARKRGRLPRLVR